MTGLKKRVRYCETKEAFYMIVLVTDTLHTFNYWFDAASEDESEKTSMLLLKGEITALVPIPYKELREAIYEEYYSKTGEYYELNQQDQL